jgi:hypothetical protein
MHREIEGDKYLRRKGEREKKKVIAKLQKGKEIIKYRKSK